MAKVYIKTYGCQMNERDSEQVAQMFVSRGHAIVPEPEQADVVLLNTCSVRDLAEQKALGKMGMLGTLAQARPMVFGFLGCMAQSRGETLLQDVPHLNLVVGTQKFHRVVDHVEDLLRRQQEALWDDLRLSLLDTASEPNSQSTIRDHLQAEPQVSAFVSIMQGCNMRCSFCIVPSTRGEERSRPIAEIVDEVERLVATGTREVTLLGQIVNLYGRHEFPRTEAKSPFVQLLEAVHEVRDLERLRFTSPHPIGFRPDLVAAIRDLPKLVEHVHLPLQSGSDRILKAMRRTYTSSRYRDLVAELRAAVPAIAITTDIIVGFPGETETDYNATRSLAEEVGFDNAFVFKYSPRKDTPAAALPDQVSEADKEARNHDLLETVNAWARRRGDAYVGRKVEILVEGPSKTNPNRLMGRTRSNKIVVFEGPRRLIGGLLTVHIMRSTGFTLFGEPVLAS
jgi:tRNA-2-methylthio-N6-dimethylallyladenosine synthase